MKKFLSLLLILSVVTCSFVACGCGNDGGNPPDLGTSTGSGEQSQVQTCPGGSGGLVDDEKKDDKKENFDLPGVSENVTNDNEIKVN